jgi:hypothetical protein
VAQKAVVQMARTGALFVAAVYCFGALIVPWITAASSVRLALDRTSGRFFGAGEGLCWFAGICG